MQMKDYLLDTFKFNDGANKKLLSKIKLLDDKEESIKLFSHLINSQNKWMARIKQHADYENLSWWEPLYNIERLATEWNESLDVWRSYLINETDEELAKEKTFIGFDGSFWAATPADIALQLNYHSIHHRAQVQTIIRQQGLEPDFLDYIGTRYKRLG
ncbi:MAG: DinB family protein [Ginsengibacter sp.]